MKERPIIFNSEMVRAILDGRKTQTRRPINPPKGYRIEYAGVDFPCPYGFIDDRLWVRETWSVDDEEDSLSQNTNKIWYMANEEHPAMFPKKRPSIHMPRWASRITLEITNVRVERLQNISAEDAKSEGLKAVTKDGGRTIKYGIPDRDGWPGTDDYGWAWDHWNTDPVLAYKKLWDSIYGKTQWAWKNNPWVWVVDFKKL